MQLKEDQIQEVYQEVNFKDNQIKMWKIKNSFTSFAMGRKMLKFKSSFTGAVVKEDINP